MTTRTSHFDRREEGHMYADLMLFLMYAIAVTVMALIGDEEDRGDG